MPATDDNTVVVNVYGKNYTIALESGQTADQVLEIAQLVDTGMREVRTAHYTPSPVQTAVLAGLNLVEELFSLQSDYHAAETDIEQRASRLTASLGKLFEENRTSVLNSDPS
jgi:cell division protein ZapA (FtsZ GTPase activity inhibitor)